MLLQFSHKVRKSTEAVHRMVVGSPSVSSPAMVCMTSPESSIF